MTEPARQYDVAPPRRPPIWRLALMLFFLGVVSLAMVVLARGCEASLATVGPSDASRCVWLGEEGPSRSIHDGRCEMASEYMASPTAVWPEQKTIPLKTIASDYVSTIGGDGTVSTGASAHFLMSGGTSIANGPKRLGAFEYVTDDDDLLAVQSRDRNRKGEVMMFAFQVIGVITVLVLALGALFAPGAYTNSKVDEFGKKIDDVRGTLATLNRRLDRFDRPGV